MRTFVRILLGALLVAPCVAHADPTGSPAYNKAVQLALAATPKKLKPIVTDNPTVFVTHYTPGRGVPVGYQATRTMWKGLGATSKSPGETTVLGLVKNGRGERVVEEVVIHDKRAPIGAGVLRRALVRTGIAAGPNVAVDRFPKNDETAAASATHVRVVFPDGKTTTTRVTAKAAGASR